MENVVAGYRGKFGAEIDHRFAFSNYEREPSQNRHCTQSYYERGNPESTDKYAVDGAAGESSCDPGQKGEENRLPRMPKTGGDNGGDGGYSTDRKINTPGDDDKRHPDSDNSV